MGASRTNIGDKIDNMRTKLIESEKRLSWLAWLISLAKQLQCLADFVDSESVG